MKTMLKSCFLVLFATLLGLPVARGQGNCVAKDVSSRPDCPQAIEFLVKLQEAVRSGAPQKVADLVDYPLKTSIAGKRTVIRSKKQFVKNYAQIFSAEIRCAVLSGKPDEVWGNYKGFMIADGAIWWDQILPTTPAPSSTDITAGKYPFKVIAVNPPLGNKRTCSDPNTEMKPSAAKK